MYCKMKIHVVILGAFLSRLPIPHSILNMLVTFDLWWKEFSGKGREGD